MKKMTKLPRKLAFLPAILLSFSLTACGGQGDSRFVFSLAHHNPVGGVYDYAIRHFADLVYQKTDGGVTINVFPAAQLGGERDVLEGLSMGILDMTLNTSALIMNLVPEFGLLDLPFLFEDYDAARAAIEGPGGQMLGDKLLQQHGVRMLAGWNSGFRIMMTTGTPIHNLADFSGVRMRAPETPVYIQMFQALGANPTPMPFAEVYTALQLGVVDGVEVAAEPMYTMRFHEVGSYLILTDHIFSAMMPLINEQRYQSLPPEYRAAIHEAMAIATDMQWPLFTQASEDALQSMIGYGLTAIEIDREPLRQATLPMHERFAEELNAWELIGLLSAPSN
ncbi:MAG: TRAP transporter substrate-binding protein [Spirochaetes bacterium]|nr:TRAP transporter substrate-binding protein [Spirochaetota bacterium]